MSRLQINGAWDYFGEMLPYYENRVTSIIPKDKWGQPVLGIDVNTRKMRPKCEKI
jgi:hypothetical protein